MEVAAPGWQIVQRQPAMRGEEAWPSSRREIAESQRSIAAHEDEPNRPLAD